ncbi:MAG: hypothetical protein ACRD3N_20020 [Terracidiphilus sp.]
MSTEAARVMPMPGTTAPGGERRRRRRGGDAENDRSGSLVLYFLGAGGESDSEPIVLKERFSNEGGAMVEALKRDVPYYRVEVWRSRAIVKDGSVEIKKEAVSART